MRIVGLAMVLFAAPAVMAQEPPAAKKPDTAAAKKKAAPKKVATAHKKPTPDQIRKFNELEKKKKD